MMSFTATEMDVVRGNVMVEFKYVGEGVEGDFNPNDRYDMPFLRFYLYIWRRAADDIDPEQTNYEYGDWEYIEGASACTLIDARSPEDVVKAHAQTILDAVGHLDSARVPNNVLEDLSLLGQYNPAYA